jgi:mediator of RNA polymerase II transcription subunit 15
MNPVNQEEREYLEKLKSLERYIEPLRRVIRRHGNEDNEKLAKMKKLLDILSNPDKRVPLVTLQKCEDVLKRMQLDTTDSDTADINLQANPDKNPLIDAVLKLQQNAKDGKGVSLNNSLANTFIPPIETVLGQEISLPPLPRTPPPEPAKERIPDLLQGEIARLDHRFKVMFASSQPDYHSSAIDLLCCLEDKDLPAVPHLRVSIPPNYPDYPPAVDLEKLDFLTTPFLQEVTEALSSRLNRMPHKYTLSQLLTAWELAVRSACPPSHLKNRNQPTPLFTI